MRDRRSLVRPARPTQTAVVADETRILILGQSNTRGVQLSEPVAAWPNLLATALPELTGSPVSITVRPFFAHVPGSQEYLERERTKRQIRATSSRELKVQLRPGYALVSGISRIETATATIETLFMSVWEKGAGGWKISGYASTPKPGEKYPF